MPDIIISVRGEAERRVAPELAVIHAAATAEGDDPASVSAAAASNAATVQRTLDDLRDAGVVASWSSGSVAIWSDRPWTGDGRAADPVHHASVEITATFTDPEVLSAWVDDVAKVDGIRISHVDWRLRDQTRTTVEREVAVGAVERAVERATAYASAVGRPSVEPQHIADAGLLGRDEPQAPSPMFARAAMRASDESGASYDLRPADIIVTATVEARFVAR